LQSQYAALPPELSNTALAIDAGRTDGDDRRADFQVDFHGNSRSFPRKRK
jgi:hypothetical protein